MIRAILFVLILSAISFSQTSQNIDLNDNSIWHNYTIISWQVPNLRKDTVRVSNAIPLTYFENAEIGILFRDTTNTTGARSIDSCKFIVGLQFGWLTYDINGVVDTAWSRGNVLGVDTINSLVAGKFLGSNFQFRNMDSTGAWSDKMQAIDSASVTGLNYLSHAITPYAYPFMRIVVYAIQGTKTTKGIYCRVSLIFRNYAPIKSR